ncbi:unnamed protein product [Trifolium pratense]|uniref:Uncharacterized protein n=1 Tax=Trifolium pratense TaxID=57577 RepID=A0ACB0M454_TRIPR|nr:unnamed protein product [Trifolium pratense]
MKRGRRNTKSLCFLIKQILSIDLLITTTTTPKVIHEYMEFSPPNGGSNILHPRSRKVIKAIYKLANQSRPILYGMKNCVDIYFQYYQQGKRPIEASIFFFFLSFWVCCLKIWGCLMKMMKKGSEEDEVLVVHNGHSKLMAIFCQ